MAQQSGFNKDDKLPSKRINLTIVGLVAFLLFSIGTVKAGLFYFPFPFAQSNAASAKNTPFSSSLSSQKINLLAAATNINPDINKAFDLPPIANNALVSDIAESNGDNTDETSTQIHAYTVRQGDTVSSIAKMFKVSSNTILWANDLNSKSVLKAGQELVILPVSGIMYTVKKGDTVSGIAQKYNADEGDIISYNDLSVTALQVGDNIIIPDAEIAEPQKISPKKSSGTISEPVLNNVKSLPFYPGYYARPISGGKISQELHGHNAIDFAAPVGTPIHASAAGTVIISRMNNGYNGGYGNFVVISHSNGTQTLYAHMQLRKVVNPGDRVAKGETIGYIGTTGLTTGPHVHFEIRGAKNPF